MPTQSKTHLKSWFSRGKYPTEEQFGDWMDSYVHKEEDAVPIDKVDGLPEVLNNKYDASTGKALAQRVDELVEEYERHKVNNTRDFERVDEGISELEEENEEQQEQINGLGQEVENIHEKDSAQDLDINKICELIKSGSTLDEAKTALIALGHNYTSLHALANTVKTFLETADTKDMTINTWQEIETFLQGITDTESLTTLLKDLEDNITEAYGDAIAEATEDITGAYGEAIATAVEDNAPMVAVTYSQLVSLRNSNMLRPGAMYRITDYITTVANDPEAKSAGHPFDLIVLALTTGTLSEEAIATHSPRDTDDYFATSKMEAWKVWYCLYNDTQRFQWADVVNGRGVIYRLIDEWGNDCPYDFKNIQFKRYQVGDGTLDNILSVIEDNYLGFDDEMRHLFRVNTNAYVWAYTFSVFDNNWVSQDGSRNTLKVSANGPAIRFENNKIERVRSELLIDNEQYLPQSLNNIVLFTKYNDLYCTVVENRIEMECINMTLSGYKNHISPGCMNIIAGLGCHDLRMGMGCSLMTFSTSCTNNTFGAMCSDNTFSSLCQNNIFGNSCTNNIFNKNLERNQFGHGFCSNKLGTNCQYNTFGNGCTDNSSGTALLYNSFGNLCNFNTFGKQVRACILGQNCKNNTFGDYIYNLTLDSYISYVKVTGGTSNGSRIKGGHILAGVGGTDSTNLLEITFTEGTDSYQYAGMNSAGQLKKWTPADLV